MYKRHFHTSNRSFFILGPRGTGKTTWLKSHYKKAVFYDLLHPSTYLKFQKNPELFRHEVLALPKNSIIVIDEVQKLPLLLDDVHHFLSERNNKKQFVLSGSSARKLKRSSSNLLGGRASHKFFYPLVYSEHQSDQWEDILRFGTLPECLNLKTVKQKIEFLEAYSLMYLREEIQQEAVVKNISAFSNFLDISSVCNAQIINMASLGRDSGVSRTTVKGYFQALEDTLIGSWLPVWKSKARVKTVIQPKFFFFDTGVVRTLSGQLRVPLQAPEKGFLLETYLLHELKAWNQIKDWGAKISFWKTHHNSEIDFIIEIRGKKIGIELKSSTHWKREFGKHLIKVKKENIIDRALGIYLGDRNLKTEFLEIYTLKNFLKCLEKDKLI
ncbi:MAG: AAA family ATPase [Bdellovibrionales bacterium]|nr:AAA family ATPase [Bdellovibrionales bacterium]